MRLSANHFILSAVAVLFTLSFFGGGCAQIGVSTGGPKDTLAPRLVRATPENGSRNVSSDRFRFEFDEYIDVQEIANNIFISPLQNRFPTIIVNPKDISLRFRDSLLPNTTYTINFGNSIRDINENNVLKDLSYTFSTGSVIDSLEISGSVMIAETGAADSTLLAFLYRDTDDSAVVKKKPNYISRVNSEGKFIFRNLPPTNFKLYVLKDKDGSRTYNGKAELFGFIDSIVVPSQTPVEIQLLAFAIESEDANAANAAAPKTAAGSAKKLSYSTNLIQTQDLLKPLELTFNSALKEFDSSKIYITDTNFVRLTGVRYSVDSTAKKITLVTSWQPGALLKLVVNEEAVKDSAGTALLKSDTLSFVTKTKEDYGRLTLRFNGLDLSQNPVIQFTAGERVVMSFPLTAAVWTNTMFTPGEYGVRILFDRNKDGKWTTGSFSQKLQPESVISLPQRLSVRADWDNEREINL